MPHHFAMHSFLLYQQVRSKEKNSCSRDLHFSFCFKALCTTTSALFSKEKKLFFKKKKRKKFRTFKEEYSNEESENDLKRWCVYVRINAKNKFIKMKILLIIIQNIKIVKDLIKKDELLIRIIKD